MKGCSSLAYDDGDDERMPGDDALDRDRTTCTQEWLARGTTRLELPIANIPKEGSSNRRCMNKPPMMWAVRIISPTFFGDHK